jgi:tetratricopeptide (TPR) repeat protein
MSAQGRTQIQTPDAAQTARAGGAYYEFIIGLALEMEGDAAGASAAYERAARLDPASAEIPAALATLYARQNRTTDAVAAAERAVKANPSNPEANWILGQLYYRLSDATTTPDRDRADFVARAVTALEKTNTNAHPGVPLMLAQLYFQGRDFTKAIAVLGPLVAEQPDQADAINLLVRAYQAAGRREEAVALLEKSVEFAPELYSTLAQRYEEENRWRDAAEAYEAAAGAVGGKRSLQLTLQWATALLNAGGVEEAVQARRILEEVAGSASARVLYLLSEAQRRSGDLAAAETTGRRLMAADPNNLLGAHALAQIYEDRHEYQRVIALLDPIVMSRLKAPNAPKLAGDPNFRRLCINLSLAYERLREYDKAIAVLTQTRAATRTDATLEVRIARVQLSAGRGDNAITTLQGAMAKFPDEPLVKLELGAALGRQKRFAEAETVFRQMINADPTNAEALNYLGYMLAERGQRLDESVAFVQRALTIDPGNPAYLDSLGWAYFRQGRFDLAEQPLIDAGARMPSNSVVLDHLGDLHFKRERYQDAIDAWKRALDGDGDSIKRSEVEDKIKTARQRLTRKR